MDISTGIVIGRLMWDIGNAIFPGPEAPAPAPAPAPQVQQAPPAPPAPAPAVVYDPTQEADGDPIIQAHMAQARGTVFRPAGGSPSGHCAMALDRWKAARSFAHLGAGNPMCVTGLHAALFQDCPAEMPDRASAEPGVYCGT